MAKAKRIIKKYWRAWLLTSVCIFLIILPQEPLQAALVLGVNSGFVSEAPVADPDASTSYQVGTRAVLQRHTTPATAIKITEIGFYCPVQDDEEPNWEVGIYDSAGDTDPVNLLAGVSRTNTLSTGVGWKKVTGLNITVSPETQYWIGIQVDTDTAVKHDASGGGMGFFMWLETQTTLPSEFVGGSGSTRITAIYAVWEAAAPGGFNPWFIRSNKRGGKLSKR